MYSVSPVPTSTSTWLQKVECSTASRICSTSCTFVLFCFKLEYAPGEAYLSQLSRFFPLESYDSWSQNRTNSAGIYVSIPCKTMAELCNSNLTMALTGHCIARRRMTCKEGNGTREGNVWSQLAFHIIGTKPTEASHCRRGSEGEASDQSHKRHQCSETMLTGETRFHCELWIPGTQTTDPLDRKQKVDPLDQWGCVLEWNCRVSTTVFCNWSVIIHSIKLKQYCFSPTQERVMNALRGNCLFHDVVNQT